MRFHVETVDLADYTSGDAGARQKFIQTLGDSLKDTGFVKVANHGVDLGSLDRAYDAAKRVFALPDPVKDQYHLPGTGGARGFTAFGREHAKDNPVGDLKEFWHVGPELPDSHPLKPAYGNNIWPKEEPVFKTAMTTLFGGMQTCAEVLLEAIAEYLRLPKRSLADMVVDGQSVLRVIHYPALKDRFIEGGVRASAHEDINLITLLPAATDSGLELLDREGKWHKVDGLEGEIVVDAGDMLSRHLNLKIPATTHRVVNPASADAVRYSMPFFCHPRPEVLLDTPDSLLEPGETKKFPAITAHEFLEQRLREIGLK
jgi:isopenicillin N synthase-like dioxygenase